MKEAEEKARREAEEKAAKEAEEKARRGEKRDINEEAASQKPLKWRKTSSDWPEKQQLLSRPSQECQDRMLCERIR